MLLASLLLLTLPYKRPSTMAATPPSPPVDQPLPPSSSHPHASNNLDDAQPPPELSHAYASTPIEAPTPAHQPPSFSPFLVDEHPPRSPSQGQLQPAQGPSQGASCEYGSVERVDGEASGQQGESRVQLDTTELELAGLSHFTPPEGAFLGDMEDWDDGGGRGGRGAAVSAFSEGGEATDSD